MLDWLLAFVVTVVVELPIVALVADPARRRRAAADSVAVNLFTHPLAWLSVGNDVMSWTGTEIAVAVAEAIVYRSVTRLSWVRAIAASVLANGVTAALSFVF